MIFSDINVIISLKCHGSFIVDTGPLHTRAPGKSNVYLGEEEV